MQTVIPLQDINPEDLSRVGGKAVALAKLARSGFSVPDGLCVTTEVYDAYIDAAGLRERILLELNRKEARHLRWEEVWDSALRIRNMFLRRPLPTQIREELTRLLEPRFENRQVVVRSSAPAEDSEKTSFAGLHESYVNVVGIEAILSHIRRVWASLWSDAAILYRQELHLDPAASAMAVVIQEIAAGDCAGVAFSRSPVDPDQAVIEAVHGLNQGLVDGAIEPDRWVLDRKTGAILSHTAAVRDRYMIPGKQGIQTVDLPEETAAAPPLDEAAVRRVFQTAQQAEALFQSPQDVEWTLRGGDLFVLQSRPITTGSTPSPQDDRRQWDLSLRRSFENLKALRPRVENGIQEMIAEADRLTAVHLTDMTDEALDREMARRTDILKRWTDIYWTDFIPFAHGIRLFGQVYNDAIHPEDPYEFVALLQGSRMQGLERNRMLSKMAAAVRSDPSLRKRLEAGDMDGVDGGFKDTLQDFTRRFGSLAWNSFRGADASREQRTLIAVLLRLA
ncbi:MAG: PEP/pyruvate-binding domain-containing protein, partial [Desulfococcaceae bacterium]